MPSLAQHPSTELVKLLAIGDTKTGKTGSLIALIMAGYKLGILDFDCLLDILYNKIMELCPDKINNVHFISFRDEVTSGVTGSIIKGKPRAYLDSLKVLNHWKDDTEDLGNPGDWGPDWVLVVDSLSTWCRACYDLHDIMTPQTGKSGGNYDGRAAFYSAQRDMEKQLSELMSKRVRTNVIVICHGKYITLEDGKTKIFPQGIGQALSPTIPTLFPNYIQYSNINGKRSISFESNNMIDLATVKAMPKSLPIETGLADFFAVLRKPPTQTQEQTQEIPTHQPRTSMPIKLHNIYKGTAQ